jgi:hypothetical protein
MTAATTDQVERHPDYPQEPKKPHARCGGCGRFLRWDDYMGRYVNGHLVYDSYYGHYEWDCR